MRIWSIHPKYLDAKGLVALWREALLAKKVLEGNTRGYTSHPQLDRFRASNNPVGCVNRYLSYVWEEARKRNYRFDSGKLGAPCEGRLYVTEGQLEFEMEHLLKKLLMRDRGKYEALKDKREIVPNPLFIVRSGEREAWEKTDASSQESLRGSYRGASPNTAASKR